MYQKLSINGYKLRVEFRAKLVRVYSDAALWAFLSSPDRQRFDLLSKIILDTYRERFDQPLKISQDSLSVEILVHVYCDYLGLLFNRYIPFRPSQRLINKLLKRAEIVDCGESTVDSNRWVWNILAPWKTFFIWILPSSMNSSRLKRS